MGVNKDPGIHFTGAVNGLLCKRTVSRLQPEAPSVCLSFTRHNAALTNQLYDPEQEATWALCCLCLRRAYSSAVA